MTDTRKTQLGFEVDATGARAGFESVKQGAREMAQSVTQAGTQASRGLDGIGAGGDKAAQGLDRATKSIISSVQRATAALEAGEKGGARYFETLANQRGANLQALRPYLDQLEEARRRADAAAGSVGRIGVSAAQTAAALRGVPAQFTDIFTSLASGQQPLTVLLQQGGQLKDTFGGIGAAARGLGGYIAGLVNPFSLAAVALGGLAVAYYQGAQESSEFNKQLVLSGNAAGTTVSQLNAMAQAVGAVVGTQGKAAEVLAGLAGTGRVASEQLQGAATAIVALNRSAGISVEELTKDFADLGKAPAESIAKLNEKYNFLTSATYAQIKALEEQGKVEEAAALAQKTYSNMLSDRAESVRRSLGTLERGWTSVKDLAKEAWDAMLGIGREDSLGDQIADLEARRDRFASMGGQTYGRSRQDVISDYNLQIGRLRTEDLQAQAAARSQAARLRQESDRIAAQKKWAEDSERYLSREAKLRADIQRIREQGAKAGASEAEIQQRVAFLTEQLNSKAVQTQRRVESAAEAARRNAQNDLQALQVRQQAAELDLQLMRERGVTVSQLNEGERKALEIQQELKTITDARTRSIKEQELATANSLAQTIKQREALVELLRAQQQFEDARDREAKAAEASIVQIQLRAQAAADEVAAFGLGKDAIEALTIARLEEKRAMLEGFAGSEEEIARIEREIEARKELAKQIAAKDVLEANAKAAKEAQQEWQRASQEIERSITDSLLRGFESGKGFAENLRDTVVNMFKTLVLRPVIQAAVQPVADVLAGGAGGASGGFGGLGSLLSSVFGGSGGGITGGLASGIGAIGSAFGLESLTKFATGMQGAGLASGLVGPTTAGAGGALGMGAAFAKAVPYVGAALAAIQAISSLGAFKGATYHTGSAIGINADGSTTGMLGVGQVFGDQRVWGGFTELDARGGAQFAGPLSQIGTAIVTGINETLKTFGQAGGARAFAAFGADGDDASEGQLRIYGADGRLLSYNPRNKFASNPQQGFQEYLSEAGRVARDALLSADIPGWAKQVLSSLGGSPELTAVTQAIAQINASQVQFAKLGKTFEQITKLSGSATDSLISIFGGIQNLLAASQSFVERYYSDAEKVAMAQRELAVTFGQLGLSVPASKAAFRSLVESLDLSTESGRRTYASLLGVADQFATVADATDQMAKQVRSSIEQMAGGIQSEIERIKGLALQQSGAGLAELQARFGISTAQARAGDQKAIDSLPGLSQAILAAAEASASSSSELTAIQLQTLSSLEATLAVIKQTKGFTVPAFAAGGDHSGGWRLVGERGPELEATGPARVFDAGETARILAGGRSGSDAAMQALVAEVKALRQDQRAQAAVLASYTGRTARILEGVTQDGDALTITTAT